MGIISGHMPLPKPSYAVDKQRWWAVLCTGDVPTHHSLNLILTVSWRGSPGLGLQLKCPVCFRRVTRLPDKAKTILQWPCISIPSAVSFNMIKKEIIRLENWPNDLISFYNTAVQNYFAFSILAGREPYAVLFQCIATNHSQDISNNVTQRSSIFWV